MSALEQSVYFNYFKKTLTVDETAKLVAQAGFPYLDYTPDMYKDYRAELKETRAAFEKYGLTAYQGHAPYNRYNSNVSPETHKHLVDESLTIAAELGSKYLVIHGDEYDKSQPYSVEKALAYNHDYFAPVVERAAKLGVQIAFENVFRDDFGDRYCSTAEELLALIESYHSDHVCCCWDFGHASVAYAKDQSAAIRKMGDKIRCTHVHDNYLYSDLHLIPFTGMIDWKDCMTALREKSPVDVLSFEIVYGCLPQNTVFPTLSMLHAVGDALIAL